MFGLQLTNFIHDIFNSPSHIGHDVSHLSPNIDDDVSQLYLLLLACSDRTVFNAACFFQSRKPRACMLQPSRTPKGQALHPLFPAPSVGDSGGTTSVGSTLFILFLLQKTRAELSFHPPINTPEQSFREKKEKRSTLIFPPYLY
ncbi:hypothetical protein AXF42_Ash019993 [Apostasia shenzhenica]|uniref:Uncharacterized protein n=1 Tax=Apostasia shenzhenica TaxID=1088818 RepID=A0A2H9ZSH2_9ASPA|nr:hypothetical protein AXF42_Ash019993 [Apostasia shenzhenica]